MASSTGYTAQVLATGIEVFTLTEPDLVDPDEIVALREEWLERLGSLGTPRLVIDLGRVHHLASAALGMLLVVHGAVTERDGQLALVVSSDDLREVFRLTRLDRRFAIHATVEAAAESLGD